MTGEEMCVYIAAVLRDRNGIEVSPETIWNYSPTGELWPVIEMYRDARCWRENGHYEADPDDPWQLRFVSDGAGR